MLICAVKPLMEKMRGENPVEESIGEGDGGDIMLEIVGSDVFVDGLSSEQDGSFLSGKVGDVAGNVMENTEETETQNSLEAMDVSNEGVKNKFGEGEAELLASRSEKIEVVLEGLQVRLSDSKGGTLSSRQASVLGDEVRNPGIEAMAVSSSAVTDSLSGQTEETSVRTSMVVTEGVVQDETVDNNSNIAKHATAELLNDAMVVFVVGEVGTTEEKERLDSGYSASSHDCLTSDSMMFAVETTAVAFADVAPPEISVNSNGEGLDSALVDGIVCNAAGVAADHEHIHSSHSVTMNCNISSSDIDPPTCSEVEILTTGSSEYGVLSANAESISPKGDFGIHTKEVGGEVHAAESKDLVVKLDAIYSDIQYQNQGCSKELPGIKCETTNGVDDSSHASPESVYKKSLVSERGEVMGMDLDDVLAYKDGTLSMNNLRSIGKNKCLKTDGNLEASAVLQNHVLPNEPILLVDNTTEVNKDKVNEIETNPGLGENRSHMTGSCSLPYKEIVRADSSAHDQALIAASVSEVTNNQNIATARAKIINSRGASEPNHGIHENSALFFECQEIDKSLALDVSTGNICHLPNGMCTKPEMVDIMMAENHIAYGDPVISVAVGPDNLAEKCGSSHCKEQVVGLQKTETTYDGVHVMELHVSSTNISLLDGVALQETCMVDVANPRYEVNESIEAQDYSRESNSNHIAEGHASETKPMDVEEREFDLVKEVDCRGAELGTEEPASETDKLDILNMANEERTKSTSSLRTKRLGYLSPPENDGQFALSDLVWGKVRSHPWWPGQIFDPSDASEKAVKYYKKDSYLVAYFGDRTFAWYDASLLKPFRSHFSKIEKQSTSDGFQNAVTCALEEVSRRVALGLACSCIPKDAYRGIETQVVENTGVREESSRRHGADQSSRAASFEPDKLLEFVRDLAPNASSGADRLDLVIAQAQLSAFCRFKGYCLPTGIILSGELLGNDANATQYSDEMVVSHNRRPILKDSLESRKKERSLTELLGGMAYSPYDQNDSGAKDLSRYSGKKRKTLDSLADGSNKRVNMYAAKVSTSTTQTPKPSFKIGECIRRVASQVTGSASMVKGHNDEMGINDSPKINVHPGRQSMVVSVQSFSLNEMLSQLQLVAQDPSKGHDFLNTFVTFFSGFRSSVAVNRRGRKKRSNKIISGCVEEFEFDDVNDSYWTDRIVQNYTEEQLLHSSANGTGNLHLVTFDAERPVKSCRKSHSRERYFNENYPKASLESDEIVRRMKQEASPAELILNFAERASIPSEINLNKMFRRFGPLMKSETEVDHVSGRAKVIFKRGSDAEVAHSSAEKFDIFWPVLVNYQIGYSPLISVKISPLAILQYQEDAALLL